MESKFKKCDIDENSIEEEEDEIDDMIDKQILKNNSINFFNLKVLRKCQI